MTNSKYNLRAIAAKVLTQVVEQGQSLSVTLPENQQTVSDKDKALLQELCFGVLRTLPILEWILKQLMSKPLTGKQRVLHYLLTVGLYQLIYTRIPPHAAVAETVSGAVMLKRPQLKGLINGVMRQFQRQQPELLERANNNSAHYLHPEWLLKRLQNNYPDKWQQIVEANNQKPPMWLRVNRLHKQGDEYLALLADEGINAFPCEENPQSIRLESAVPVNKLPGFDRGWVTVQDLSAQNCTLLLAPENNEYILDLCAAPGGKTTHILEMAPQSNVLAVDIDEQRVKRISENLNRLNLQATIRCGDGRKPETWCTKKTLFDRILLDAPCSATGVIRRHPDIKWLRRDRDIAELVELQREIFDAIWPYLKTGGVLVYATCSILPEENQIQVARFLEKHTDAQLVETGTSSQPGLQILPTVDGGDGFFYAKITKH